METMMAMSVPEYPKIQSVFVRDEKTHRFRDGEYSRPEFEYLADAPWIVTEKVDGMNIRLVCRSDMPTVGVMGRTDRAEVPVALQAVCQALVVPKEVCDLIGSEQVTLFGEGYGAKIQGGGHYRPDQGFVLFDVRNGSSWLPWEGVTSVGRELGLSVVPELPVRDGDLLTLRQAVGVVRHGFHSEWGEFEAEGVVARPPVTLYNARGRRVMTKIKAKDFPR